MIIIGAYSLGSRHTTPYFLLYYLLHLFLCALLLSVTPSLPININSLINMSIKWTSPPYSFTILRTNCKSRSIKWHVIYDMHLQTTTSNCNKNCSDFTFCRSTRKAFIHMHAHVHTLHHYTLWLCDFLPINGHPTKLQSVAIASQPHHIDRHPFFSQGNRCSAACR